MLHSETKQKKIKVIFYCEAQSVFLLLPSSQPVFFTDAQAQNCSQGIFPPQAPCCGGFSYHSPFTFYICVADLFNSFSTQFSNCLRENLLLPSSSFCSRQRPQQNCVLLPGTTFQWTNMSSSIHSTKSLDSKSNRPLTISIEKVTRVLEFSNTYTLLSYKCFGRWNCLLIDTGSLLVLRALQDISGSTYSRYPAYVYKVNQIKIRANILQCGFTVIAFSF